MVNLKFSKKTKLTRGPRTLALYLTAAVGMTLAIFCRLIVTGDIKNPGSFDTVPEQITEVNVWYQNLLLKINFRAKKNKLQYLHNVTRSSTINNAM